MELLHNLFVFIHFVGFAALFGGAFVQFRSDAPVVNNGMLHGAWTQLVSGLVLVVFKEFGTDPVNHAKIGVKLVILIVILALVLMNQKKASMPKGTFWAIFGLTALNAAVAVFWE